MDSLKVKLNCSFGIIGSCLPLIVLVGNMLLLSVFGKANISFFNESAFLALMVAFLIVKDKKEFECTILKSLMNETLMLIILSFILAGVLSQLLRQSGLVNGLIWLVAQFHIDLRFLPLITFIISILMSAFCGTTNGSIITVAPILLPLANAYGARPEVIMGAIMSGCIMGHGLIPTCDTSIISALTQESDIKRVTLTRLPYVMLAGLCAGVMFYYTGRDTAVHKALLIDGTNGPGWSLVMLMIPLALLFLVAKGYKLITTLFVCNLLAIILNLCFGLIDTDFMFSLDGPIYEGIAGMMNIIVFCILLFCILGIVEAGGFFDCLFSAILRICSSKRSAEFMVAITTLIGSICIGADVPVIAAVGPFVRKIGKIFEIKATRTANIMDTLSTAGCGLLPYNTGFLIAIEMAVSSGVVENTFSYVDVIPYCFYSMAAVILVLISILIPNKLRNKGG